MHDGTEVEAGPLAPSDSSATDGGSRARGASSGRFGPVEEQAGVYRTKRPSAPSNLSSPRSVSKALLRVLVVDDDEPILELIQLILESGGYQCVAARSGREAIAIFGQHGSDIGVVVTDLSMPGLDGAALIHLLRQIRPELPCIGMSGSDTGSDEDLWRGQSITHVEKPFTARDLLGAVEQLFPRAT